MLAFVLLVGIFQGIVLGEDFAQEVPKPGDALDEDQESFGITDALGLLLDFVLWPFEIVVFIFKLSSLSFVPGLWEPVRLAFQLVTGVVLGWTIIVLMLATFRTIGEYIPLT